MCVRVLGPEQTPIHIHLGTSITPLEMHVGQHFELHTISMYMAICRTYSQLSSQNQGDILFVLT